MEKLKVHIAKTLYDNVFPYIRSNKTTIFLIGASSKNSNSIRSKLRDTLAENRSFTKLYDIYYPEEIFADLLYDSKLDLLSLENLLASSVHLVVICVESWGSVAELGAFVNHDKLNKKLLVIVNEKHKNARSFIRQGPVRFLELKNRGKTNPIIWFNFSTGNMDDLSKKVHQTAYKITKDSKVERSLRNPIVAQDFFLMLIHILGTSTADEIKTLMQKIEPVEPQEISTIVYSALRALFKQRSALLQNGQYILTKSGHERLLNSFSVFYRVQIDKIMDELRILYLNKLLRNRA